MTAGITIAAAMAQAPAKTNKTAIIADLTQLAADLDTAVSNGGLASGTAAELFGNLLLTFAQELATNLES
jgi:hypothetical protein